MFTLTCKYIATRFFISCIRKLATFAPSSHLVINPSIVASIDRSIHRSIDRSTYRSIPIYPRIHRSFDQSIDPSTSSYQRNLVCPHSGPRFLETAANRPFTTNQKKKSQDGAGQNGYRSYLGHHEVAKASTQAWAWSAHGSSSVH